MFDREPKAGDLLNLVKTTWFWSKRTSNFDKAHNEHWWMNTEVMPKNTPILVVETYHVAFNAALLNVTFLYDGSYYHASASVYSFKRDFDIISSIENKNEKQI